MCNERRSCVTGIITANRTTMPVLAQGDISIELFEKTIKLEHVLYAPDASSNLVSVGCLVLSGCPVDFKLDGSCLIFNKKNQKVAQGWLLTNRLYKLETSKILDCDKRINFKNVNKNLSFASVCVRNKCVDKSKSHQNENGLISPPSRNCIKNTNIFKKNSNLQAFDVLGGSLSDAMFKGRSELAFSGCGYQYSKSAYEHNNFSNSLVKTDPNSRRGQNKVKNLDIKLRHRRLGHMNVQYLMKLKNFAADGVAFSEQNLPVCEICNKGKMVRKPFPPLKQ